MIISEIFIFEIFTDKKNGNDQIHDKHACATCHIKSKPWLVGRIPEIKRYRCNYY